MGGGSELNIEEIQKELMKPFPQESIEWRVSRCFKTNGKAAAWVVPYIKSRDVMERLDEVVGIGNWENEYKTIHNGVICGIRIWFSDTKSRIKWDGSDLTNVEPTKGALSNSLKRAAVQWGIGRYLYDLTEKYVEIDPDTRRFKNYINDTKKQIVGSWNDPPLPNWALPETNDNQTRGNNNNNGNKPTQANGETITREQVLGKVKQYEQVINLAQYPDYIIRIFNKANNKQINNISYIQQEATMDELKNYYYALKPVRDLRLAAKKYNCSMDQILYFTQIIKPETEIKNESSLFFLLNSGEVKRIIGMAKQRFEKSQTA